MAKKVVHRFVASNHLVNVTSMKIVRLKDEIIFYPKQAYSVGY